MARRPTGAWTTQRSERIELSYLLKQGYVIKGKITSGVISWTGGSKISITTAYTKSEKYIKLSYTIRDIETAKKTDFDYKIYFTEAPSNLGIGKVLYFTCPSSGKRCRILYKAYDSDIWKSRDSYQNRLYYDIQKGSKYDYNTTRYFAIQSELKELCQQQEKSHYRGRTTRLQQRILKLQIQSLKFDRLRMQIVPKAVEKFFSERNIPLSY